MDNYTMDNQKMDHNYKKTFCKSMDNKEVIYILPMVLKTVVCDKEKGGFIKKRFNKRIYFCFLEIVNRNIYKIKSYSNNNFLA